MTRFAYEAGTYESRNPLKRFSHRTRFNIAAELAIGYVLDYGCGDGHFLALIRPRVDSILGYDPWPGAQPPTSIPFVRSLTSVDQRFDRIFCLEVLEHCPDAKVREFLTDARRLLKPDGVVVVSVPVMIGPAGFVKVLHYLGTEDYTWHAALRYLVGRLPERRAFYPGGGMTHAGFDYRELRALLTRTFRSIEQRNSPFPRLPTGLNSQVFFICSGIHQGAMAQ